MTQNFWSEEKDSQARYVIPDRIMDFVFAIDCKCLPCEHMFALYQALQKALPWLESEQEAGIHPIYGAESGNGWQRPEDDPDALMPLSRRQKLTLRMPKTREADLRALVGQTLDIAGQPLTVGKMNRPRLLSDMPTIFARFVVSEGTQDEARFLEQAAAQLQALDIRVRKMLAGRERQIRTPDGIIHTRSLMIADLTQEESVRLQEHGLGSHRHLGCGLFLPQKGIKPVNAEG